MEAKMPSLQVKIQTRLSPLKKVGGYRTWETLKHIKYCIAHNSFVLHLVLFQCLLQTNACVCYFYDVHTRWID